MSRDLFLDWKIALLAWMGVTLLSIGAAICASMVG